MLTFILQPYSRVNTENPYPILDLFPNLLFHEPRSLLQSVRVHITREDIYLSTVASGSYFEEERWTIYA